MFKTLTLKGLKFIKFYLVNNLNKFKLFIGKRLFIINVLIIKKIFRKSLYDLMNYFYPNYLKDLNRQRFGKDGDGGYVIPVNLCSQNSLFLSFGINNDVSFENDVIRNTTVEKIYCFDPSIDELPLNSNPSLIFHKIGLAGKCKNNLITLEQILQKFDFKNYDSLNIKMDIESFEWDVFKKLDMAKYEKIGFIAAEFHLLDTVKFMDLVLLPYTVYKRINIYKKISKYFYIYHIHANNHSYLHFNNFSFPVLLELTLIPKVYFQNTIVNNMSKYNQPNDILKKDIQFPFN